MMMQSLLQSLTNQSTSTKNQALMAGHAATFKSSNLIPCLINVKVAFARNGLNRAGKNSSK